MEDNFIHDEYKELMMQLQEEIDGEYITAEENLFIIRQAFEVDYNGHRIRPVVDFFFSQPSLKEVMTYMKAVDVKKMLFDMLKELPEGEDNEDLKAAIDMHIGYLKDYTGKNNKRNDKECMLVTVKESDFPMMIYFEEDKVSDKIETMTAAELLEELKKITA